MNKEEKEAIEQLKSWRDYIIKNKDKVNKANDIEFYLRTVLNLIQKQEKIIDKMTEDIEEHMSEEVYNFLYICDKCKSNNEECHGDYCTETIKEYFKKEVEKE